MALSIRKPSFWRSDREIRDASHTVVGKYRLTGFWQMKAEGEAQGRKLILSYTGWDTRYSQMTDASGNVIARIEPTGWWGTSYKLTYNGKEYRWKMNGWGTAFMLYEGETEIIRVHPGGYFKEGSVTTHRPMENKDLIPLVIYGLYQQHLVASNTAATGTVTS